MIDGKHLNKIFERNLYVLKRDLKDVTNEESYMQPPFKGNCINWVTGHLAASRVRVLFWLGVETDLMSDAHYERYLWGSEPILAEEPGLLSIEESIALIEALGELLSEKLNAISEADLAETVGEGDNAGLRVDKVEFMAWHGGYHVGQFEYLRQMVGRGD